MTALMTCFLVLFPWFIHKVALVIDAPLSLTEFSPCHITCYIPEFLVGHGVLADVSWGFCVCWFCLVVMLVTNEKGQGGHCAGSGCGPVILKFIQKTLSCDVLTIKQVEVLPLNIYPEAGWTAGEKIAPLHTDSITVAPPPRQHDDWLRRMQGLPVWEAVISCWLPTHRSVSCRFAFVHLLPSFASLYFCFHLL